MINYQILYTGYTVSLLLITNLVEIHQWVPNPSAREPGSASYPLEMGPRKWECEQTHPNCIALTTVI
nr:CMF_HP1_G0048160.mRNA.1.CDS.1 [Saccharomyces cerevisiae]